MSKLTYNKVDLGDIIADTDIFDLAIEGIYDGVTYTIVNAGNVRLACSYLYGDRHIYVPDGANTYDYLSELWNSWLFLNIDDYIRAYIALISDYNPINNYDSHEVETYQHGHKLDETYIAGTGSTSSSTYTPGVTDTTQSSIYGYNSSTPGDADKVVNTKTGSDSTQSTTTRSGSDSNSHIHSGTDTRTVDKAGNIGTTKTQEMILDEINLRKKDFGEMLIKIFIDTYTAY